MSIGRRWYLVARDVRKPEWRTWRVDRIVEASPTGHRFLLADPPDAAAVVQRAISTAPYRHQARVELHAAVLTAVAERVPATVAVHGGDRRAHDAADEWCRRPRHLALHIGLLDVDFHAVEPVELRDRMHELGARLARSTANGGSRRLQ